MKKIVWLVREYESNYGSTEYSPAIVFWYGILEKLGYDIIYYPYESYNADVFYQEMKNYNPNYIIHAGYHNVHPEFYRLKEFTKIIILQSDDDWRYDSFGKFWIPFVDYIVTLQGDRSSPQGTRCRDLIDWYVKDGLKENQIQTVRCAFNPNTMLVDSFSSKDIFVSHGGSLYGERPSLIQKFNSLGVPVTVANNVSYNQLLDVWNRSKFSLSFTKASDGQFRQKKGRIGEIGYYSVVVSEPFPNIEEYYENDKEFILFNSVEEAVEKIKYYNSNEKEYNRLLLNSRNRLWNTNTAFHQWDELMSKIDEDYIRKDINKILNGYKQPL
jgi:hypothetical protein